MSKKLKILAIPSWYPTDSNPGFGIFVKRHLIEIARFCEVHVLYFDFNKQSNSNGFRYATNVIDGIHEHSVCVASSFGKLGSLLLTWYWYIRLVLLGPLGNHQIKHVHVPYHIAVFLAPFLLISRLPLVITEHWSGYFAEDGRFANLSGFFRMTIRALFKRADCVSAVSEPLASSIRRSLNLKNEIQIIPNVVDLDINVRSASGVKPDNFLMIANFNNAEKNITGVIDAFTKFRINHPQAILTIVGAGPDFDMILNYVTEKGHGNGSINLPGFVSNNELSKYFSYATCYILNSNFETFSISTLEALLYGVPVIATKCKGPESFVNSKNGLLI
ncbi:MAG: glycosyltransferase, partial [Bacteroidota bacterium]